MRLEEGAPHIHGYSTVSELGTEDPESEVGGVASRVREARPYYQHVSPRQEGIQKGEREGAGAEMHSRKAYQRLKVFCRSDAQVQADIWRRRQLGLDDKDLGFGA